MVVLGGNWESTNGEQGDTGYPLVWTLWPNNIGLDESVGWSWKDRPTKVSIERHSVGVGRVGALKGREHSCIITFRTAYNTFQSI